MTAPILLALDPSIAAFGWAAIALAPTPLLVAAGVIETKPASAKKRKAERISVAEDDARRMRWIRRQLSQAVRIYSPVIAAIEVPFGSQAAKAAKALGAAQAIAACVVDEHLDGRAVYITVHEAGDAIGIARTQRVAKGEPRRDSAERAESSKARKQAVARAVVDRLGLFAWIRALGLEVNAAAGGDVAVMHHRFEGAHDAAAVGLAAWERPEIAALRAMAAAA